MAGDVGSGHAPWWAYALPLLAVAGLAAGTLLERRWRPQASVPAALGVQTATAGLVFLLVASVRGDLAPPATSTFAGAIAWLVVLASFGGYGSYLFVVRRSGATAASTLLYLTPPTSALAAWAMFGQTPGPTAVPGLLVCAAGVTLALHQPPEASAPRNDTASAGSASVTSTASAIPDAPDDRTPTLHAGVPAFRSRPISANAGRSPRSSPR